MVAILDTPKSDLSTRDFAAELQAARAKVAECDAAIIEWQDRLKHAEQDAARTELKAGDSILAGGKVADAGSMIAASRAAVAATQRGLDAAKRNREQAYINLQWARARELRHQIAQLEAFAERQRARFAELWEIIRAKDGVCLVTWRMAAPGDLQGLMEQASAAESNARQRQVQLDRQSPVHA